MTDKTARKIHKARANLVPVQEAVTDLPDWLVHTDPSGWDLDVLRSYAKQGEAFFCQLRRLLDDPEIVRAAS